jgi:hypothetical protein
MKLITCNTKKVKLAALAIVLALCTHAQAESKRSYKAKKAFKIENPCPSTGKTKGSCPGYIIDHITPLACNGEDAPINMQWQTQEDAKQKDKWERVNC